jgi:hypothetical protein
MKPSEYSDLRVISADTTYQAREVSRTDLKQAAVRSKPADVSGSNPAESERTRKHSSRPMWKG